MKLRNNKKGSAEEAKGDADDDENDTKTGLGSTGSGTGLGSGVGTGSGRGIDVDSGLGASTREGAMVRGILGGMVVQEEVVDVTGVEGSKLIQPFVEGTTHPLDLQNH